MYQVHDFPSTSPAPTGPSEGVWSAGGQGCWFCDDDLREMPPGGWLLDDGTWRAGAAPAGMSIPGTVVVETRRHILDQADFTATEKVSYASVIGRLVAAIRTATDCDRVYQWASMDAYPHFHQWLLPWWSTSELRGPGYLAASVGGGGDEREVAASVSRIASVLVSD